MTTNNILAIVALIIMLVTWYRLYRADKTLADSNKLRESVLNFSEYKITVMQLLCGRDTPRTAYDAILFAETEEEVDSLLIHYTSNYEIGHCELLNVKVKALSELLKAEENLEVCCKIVSANTRAEILCILEGM